MESSYSPRNEKQLDALSLEFFEMAFLAKLTSEKIGGTDGRKQRRTLLWFPFKRGTKEEKAQNGVGDSRGLHTMFH